MERSTTAGYTCMKQLMKGAGYIAAGCVLVLSLYACKGNSTATKSNCADSSAGMTTTTTTTDTAMTSTSASAAGTGSNSRRENGASNGNTKVTESGVAVADNANANEPTSPVILNVTSTAFANNGTIPIKYTCDGQGATPPINVSNVPPGTKSLTLIVHDYHSTGNEGFTFWIIWNLDTLGIIPENFTNNHEGMNAAKGYGYTPLCAKSGNHKYHFTVYALDAKLVIGKNTTKEMIEKVMMGHVLAKGDLVGVYNKQLQ